MEYKTYIEDADIELAFIYIAELTHGLLQGAFDRSTHGILDPVPQCQRNRGETGATYAEQGSNARDWIIENYEATAGALGLINVAADIFGRTLQNGDIKKKDA